MGLEVHESCRPKDPIVIEPVCHFHESVWRERISPGLCDPPLMDEPGGAEDADVSRDSWPTDRELSGEFTGAPLAGAEQIQYRAPRRIGDGSEYG